MRYEKYKIHKPTNKKYTNPQIYKHKLQVAAFKEAFDAFDWNKSGNISYGSLQVNLKICRKLDSIFVYL